MKHKDQYTAFGKFIRLFLPIAAIIIAGNLILFQTEINTALTEKHMSEKAAIQLGVHSIKRIVQSITSDIAFLASQKALIETVSDGDDQYHDILGHDWSLFSRSKGIYDQIRWLDSTGQERIRVNFNNGKPELVPNYRLQNKGSRYYYTDSLKLNKNEFFISPLDLNIERGEIEQPLKPMIRIGTPVFSSDFKKRGIVLLNYFGKTLLKEYGRVMGDTSPRAWLLNRDSDWMKGPSPELEWGFMFKRDKATLAHHFPEVWDKIFSSAQGQFEDKHGLWTFATIYPVWEGQKTSTGTHEVFASSRSNLDAKEYFWKSVLLLPTEQYHSGSVQIITRLTIVTLLLLAGLAWGTWRLSSAWEAEEKAEEELRRINQNLESAIDERTKELQHEIVERKRTEKELREREERFRSITTTSSVTMIITVDDEGNVVTWNTAAENFFGYKEKEMIGQSISKIMPERYRDKSIIGLKQAVKSKKSHLIGKTVELWGLRKSGEEFPIELSLGTWIQSNRRYFNAIIHDISERKIAEDKLKYLANHDTLTGLPTRRLCFEYISKAISLARRNKNNVAILFIDLDGFKSVNDTMGHDAGDDLLVEVAERLKSCIREVDTVARMGGDEFVVVLTCISNVESVENVAKKLINTISHPFHLNGNKALISASIGIALYPDNGMEPDLLMKIADGAMYSVKEKGKNNFSFASK